MNISISHANSVLKLSQGQPTAVLKIFRTFKALRKKLLRCTILVKANVCLENSFLIVHIYTACFSYILN